MRSLRILVAGDWHSELHEQTVVRALQDLGQDVHQFAWHGYFQHPGSRSSVMGRLLRAQNRFLFGPRFEKLNRDFEKQALLLRPDAIFIYRGTHIRAATIRRIKAVLPSTVVVGYNNDDPFSTAYPKWLWRHFLACVPLYDLTLAYRLHNVDDFRSIGAKRVELLRSWFDPTRNYPVSLNDNDKDRFECDVVFVGHYEDDHRQRLLEEIERRGWHLRIFGPGYDWDPVIRNSENLAKHVPVSLVWGEDYNKALAGAKLALCFLSKLNRDTYTRRCFEIPASGTVLLSERTNDLVGLFEEGKEAVFFDSADEMCEAIRGLLVDDNGRRAIAEAGKSRVWSDGHDVTSRMRSVLGWIEEIAGATA